MHNKSPKLTPPRTGFTSKAAAAQLSSPLGADKMKQIFILLALLLSPAFIYAGDWEHAPKSSDYAVHKIFKGKPAPVKLKHHDDKLFRTALRERAKKGPNFAGHYTMAVIGCGLDAFFIAVIDAKTGDVYWPPFGCIALAGGFGIPLPSGAESPNPAFRLDSKLFVIVGLEDKEDSQLEDRAAQFWIFNNGQFQQVYSIPATLPKEESDP